MGQPVIQASFNSGEWAPQLFSRVDIQKYHSGAALLENFFVDYRGGASSRSGTRYIIRAYKDSTAVRVITFQASIYLGFALEFGDGYIRFHRNGAPVLETGLNITGATQANPCVLTVANSYTTGDVDWIYVTGVGGMTQLNGKYYIVHARDATHVTLYDLFGNPVDATGYTAYTSGGTTQRVYTLASPYAAGDLFPSTGNPGLKFVQNVNSLILVHPSYAPYILTYNSPTSWTIGAITFGTTISAPTGVAASTTLGGGSVYYSYIVTAVDGQGQESAVSSAATLSSKTDIRTTPGTNTISWTPVSGAASYNVYKAGVVYNAAVASGAPYGYIGNTTGSSFTDSNISEDFSQPPPIASNPFSVGSAVTAITIGIAGSYTTAPTIAIAAPVGGGITATAIPILKVVTATVSAGGSGYTVGDTISLSNGVELTVATVSTGAVATVTITLPGSATTLPANPVSQDGTSGSGTGATFTLAWGVYDTQITNGGTGYSSPGDIPAITFSAGAATATATLGPAQGGNPSVATFFQQRFVLGGTNLAPETLYFSKPGLYYNYDTSNPIQADDAFSAPIVSTTLSDIKSLIAQPGGLIVFTDGVSYLLNGGSLGSAVTPSSVTANQQSFVGSNDMPPIVVNFDILTATAKGCTVRDSTYNFYANVFTGSDISILSSHLFFGYQLVDWAWAEEPYKIVWTDRSDGTLLSLTFIKEQEFIGWSHHTTEGGAAQFKSVCTLVEAASVGYQNFTYHVVARTIGVTAVKYIEYMPERGTSSTAQDYVTVDCSISYSGTPQTAFQGGEFLAGKTCTGLADGVAIPAFVMPANGDFTLGTAASKVTVGLAFTPKLKTLAIDTGEPTIQSKMKKINAGTIRVVNTLGLSIGTDESNLTTMKDLVVGNVGSMTNTLVSGLVTGDARTFLDPLWQEQGTYYIEQPNPYPATITGVIPQLTVGDTEK